MNVESRVFKKKLEETNQLLALIPMEMRPLREHTERGKNEGERAIGASM